MSDQPDCRLIGHGATWRKWSCGVSASGGLAPLPLTCPVHPLDPARAAFVEQVREDLRAFKELPTVAVMAVLVHGYGQDYIKAHGLPATLEAIAEALRAEAGTPQP